MPGITFKRIIVSQISTSVMAIALCGPSFAQSGAEANAWASWCAGQNGHVDNSSGNLVCIPGAVSAGPQYSADQQAMLDLAGQFGSALGAAIRESFQRSAERQQRLIMQRSWEAERARLQAAADFEEQRLRNETLIASMHGAIGASELGRTQLGTETLRLRTADQMFNTGGEDRGVLTQEVPISAPIDLADMQAAQDAYFEALDDLNDADQAVIEKESYLDDLHTFLAEAQHMRGEQSILLAAMSANDPAHAAAEARLAQLDAALAELHEGDAVATRDLIDLRADAARAREAFRAAAQRRSAATPPVR